MESAHKKSRSPLFTSLIVAAGVGVISFGVIVGTKLPLASILNIHGPGETEIKVDGLSPELALTGGLMAFGMALTAWVLTVMILKRNKR